VEKPKITWLPSLSTLSIQMPYEGAFHNTTRRSHRIGDILMVYYGAEHTEDSNVLEYVEIKFPPGTRSPTFEVW
jgi:hypothetical protein